MWQGIDFAVSGAAAWGLGTLTGATGLALAGPPGAVAGGIAGGAAGGGAGSAAVDAACSLIEDGRVDWDRARQTGRRSLYMGAVGGTAGVAIGRAARPVGEALPRVAGAVDDAARNLTNRIPQRAQPYVPPLPGMARDAAAGGIGWGAVELVNPQPG